MPALQTHLKDQTQQHPQGGKLDDKARAFGMYDYQEAQAHIPVQILVPTEERGKS